MSLGGGGSSGGGGGAIVSQISPQAYQTASAYQGMGLNQAASTYASGINTAINSIRQQYNTGQMFQQPYSQSGQQALYQLNYMLGLDSVKPGDAPKAPTVEELAKDITNNDVSNYIRQNSGYTTQRDARGSSFITPTYTGYGTNQGDQGYDSLMAQAAAQAADARAKGFSGDERTIGAWGNGLETRGAGFGGIGPADAAAAFSISGPAGVREAAKLGLANEMLRKQMPGYEQQVAEYNQQKALYDQYAAKGTLTGDQLQNIVQSQPGYAAEQAQGIDAIQRSAASKGMLNSGRMLTSLMDYGQNTMSKYYGSMLSNLAGLAGMGQQSANTRTGLSANLGNTMAGLQQASADSTANSQIAYGNAMAQSAIGQGTSYKMMGGSSGGGGSGLGGVGSILGGLGSIAAGGGFSGLFK